MLKLTAIKTLNPLMIHTAKCVCFLTKKR